MRACRLAGLVVLVVLLLGVVAAGARKSVRGAAYGLAEEAAPQVEVRGVWGRAVTSFAFAQRVYWLYPVQEYAGLEPEACRLVDAWVSRANERILAYRRSSGDYLQPGLPAKDLARLVVRDEKWEVRLTRLQYALKPDACRYYLVVRRVGPAVSGEKGGVPVPER
ncbi:MAG: hypothetical protein AB1776_03605 [Bacillota bacterium]